MKKILIFLALFSLAQANDETAKVVYDLTTKDVVKFEKKILKGIVAHTTYYEGNLRELDVVVVIHGDAYKYFVKDIQNTKYKNEKELVNHFKELKKRIASISETYNVKFLMCGVGMSRNGLGKKDLAEFVEVIPNSTIGLIDKQNEGYAYIHVGD